MSYQVQDLKTGRVVRSCSTLAGARRSADRLDLAHGAVRYRVLPCASSAPVDLTYSVHRSAPDSAIVRRSDGALGRLDAYSGRLRGDLATDPAALAALQSYLAGERS